MESLEDTHAEWLDIATKTFRDMESHGFSPVKVDVDVEELVAWCQERRLPVDAKARAQFIAYKLQQAAGLRPKPSKAN